MKNRIGPMRLVETGVGGKARRKSTTSASRSRCLLFLVIFIVSPHLLPREGHPEMEMLLGRRSRIVLFGDSITEQSFRRGGWGASLADHYSRKADVVVRGYGGYNTKMALHLLNHIFPSDHHSPFAVTVFFGANDAALLGRTNERQHVPIDEYKKNLGKIVEHLKERNPNVLIVLITPPPVDEDGRREYARTLYGDKAAERSERTNEVTGLYAQVCVELAKELHLPYINLWSLMQEVMGWQKKYLSDGLHLTEEGNSVVHKEVVKVLEEAGFRAPNMPYDFPHHSLIDTANIEKSFLS